MRDHDSTDKTDKLIRLNRLEVSIGIVVGLLTIASAVGSFVLLPYRVNAMEIRVEVLEQARAADHELLVRMDERLKSIQRVLRIPDEPRQ